MKKLLLILIIFQSCSKSDDVQPSSSDLFVYPVDRTGAPLVSGRIKLYNLDTTEVIRSQDFDLREEPVFYFSNVSKSKYVVFAVSGSKKGYASVDGNTSGVSVTCK